MFKNDPKSLIFGNHQQIKLGTFICICVFFLENSSLKNYLNVKNYLGAKSTKSPDYKAEWGRIDPPRPHNSHTPPGHATNHTSPLPLHSQTTNPSTPFPSSSK